MAADEEILGALANRELDVMSIQLLAKASRTAITLEEFVQVRLLQGSSAAAIRSDLLSDLLIGGRIFGEFRTAVKATASGGINRIRDVGQFSENGVTGKFRWAAVLVNTCPDCMERHGSNKKWEEWEADGLPRSGQTVCKERCRCMLVPSEFTELEPIKRKPR